MFSPGENVPEPKDRTSASPSAANGFGSSQKLSAKWQASIAAVSQLIENYREALIERGVPDCKWLDNTLAKIKASMLEQAGYELDVSSGRKNISTNNPHAYQYPLDYSSYYDDLARSFSEYCLKGTNPNYRHAPQWRTNCQRCVVAYEMRRRGKDVTAHPATYGSSHLAHYPFDAWISPDIKKCKGSGKGDIEKEMSSWENGSRAQVVVYWDSPLGGGHTFIAERRNGVTVFVDPQTGDEDVSCYFKRVCGGMTCYCRIDNLQPSHYKNECCKEETHV